MEAAKKGQVARSAAEIYDEFFVPALFGEWAGPVAAAARLRPGDKVLDVACGTGVLAREAWKCVQPGGSVTGLDCNDGMLSAARRSCSEIDWRHGFAENLPFDDASHGAVVSQFGLMFFEDRVTALREMARVLMPQGRLCVAVWDSVETSPGYAAMIEVLDRLFGAEVADALRAPFVLGNKVALSQLFADAGIDSALIVTRQGEARFPSIADWVRTDVKGWTLADMIDDEQYAALLKAAQEQLQHFAQPDGSVRFAAPGHIVTSVI